MKEVYVRLIEGRKELSREHYWNVLIDLIKSNDYKIVGEIGVAKGRTCKRILKRCSSIKVYWAIDHWKHYESCDRYGGVSNDDWELMYSGVCDLIQWFRSLRIFRIESIKAAGLFPPEYFDFLFIDADHKYESVKEDVLVWLPKVKKGGLICGHDYPDDVKRKKYRGVVAAVNEILGRENIMLFPGNIWAKEM